MKRGPSIAMTGVGVRGLRRRVGSFKRSRGRTVRAKKAPVLTMKKYEREVLDPYEEMIAALTPKEQSDG